jgi:hypothetical protein
METTIFDNLYKQLQTEIDEIHRKTKHPLMAATNCLEVCDKTINKLSTLLKSLNQLDEPGEIEFFKHIKPKFVSLILYYNEIIRIEYRKPIAGKCTIQSYYHNQLQELQQYFVTYNKFYDYYRNGRTEKDKFYFRRRTAKQQVQDLSIGWYVFDETFTTPRDPAVAQILANLLLIDYINARLSASKSRIRLFIESIRRAYFMYKMLHSKMP